MHGTGCQICADISLSRQTSHANSTGLGEESTTLSTVKLHYQQVCCIIRLTCIIKKKKKKYYDGISKLSPEPPLCGE